MVNKVFCAAVAALTVAFAFAADESLYSFDSSTGRIEINKNLSAFSFNMSGVGAGDSVQYVLYRHVESAGDLEARQPIIGTVSAGGTMSFDNLNEGDTIAFMLNSSFDSTGFTMSEADYLVQFGGGASGGTLTISNVKAKAKAKAPSGQPLPGLLAVLLVGGAGAGALKLRKHRA